MKWNVKEIHFSFFTSDFVNLIYTSDQLLWALELQFVVTPSSQSTFQEALLRRLTHENACAAFWTSEVQKLFAVIF